VLQAVFLSWFLQAHAMQHIYFFKRQRKKIKELHPQHEQKPTPKKTA
jgi:trehalose utilization protein